MPELPEQIDQRIMRYRNLVLGLFYGLFISLFLNSLGLTTGLTPTTFVFWFLQVAPLSLFIKGLHQVRPRTYQWLSFVVLMYFVHGVLTAFTPGKLLLGLLETTLCTLLFVCLIFFIRKHRQFTSSSVV
ncbi:MAG: DUF2069 domain-containing protein [Gammaproteobacteria bacterium]|nr:DUF2069 domain-containing protein [Gammaproteobacteria bacterium]